MLRILLFITLVQAPLFVHASIRVPGQCFSLLLNKESSGGTTKALHAWLEALNEKETNPAPPSFAPIDYSKRITVSGHELSVPYALTYNELLDLSLELVRAATIQKNKTEARIIVRSANERLERFKALFPNVMLLPTYRRLSIEDLNELSPYPVYYIGLKKSDDEIKFDGKASLDPLYYLDHDLGHAEGMQEKKPLQNLPLRESFFHDFKKLVKQQQKPEARQALHLVWFELTHEHYVNFTPKAMTRYSRIHHQALKHEIIGRLANPLDYGGEITRPQAITEAVLENALTQFESSFVPKISFLRKIFKIK